MKRFIRDFGAIQAIIGILAVTFYAVVLGDGFGGSTGDRARGTYDLTINDGAKSANTIFALLMSCLIFLYFAYSKKKPSKLDLMKVSLMGLSVVLSSVMHSLAMLVITILITLALLTINGGRYRQVINLKKLFLKTMPAVTVILLVFGAVAGFLLANNLSRFNEIYQRTVGSNSREVNIVNFKTVVFYHTIEDLSYDYYYQPVIGIGPGQYCSRASMIVSGEFLQGGIPLIPPSPSISYTNYILPYWQQFKYLAQSGWSPGSSYFPWSSWLALYGEVGILGIILIILLISYTVYKLITKKITGDEYKKMGLYAVVKPYALIVVFIYIILMGYQDVYWETTQAILPIAILTKLIISADSYHKKST